MSLAMKYKPSEVSVEVLGVNLSGLAPDSFIDVSLDEDKVTKSMDLNGDGTFNVSANEGGTITVRVLKSSNANAVLLASRQ
jgi:hypothetical protein